MMTISSRSKNVDDSMVVDVITDATTGTVSSLKMTTSINDDRSIDDDILVSHDTRITTGTGSSLATTIRIEDVRNFDDDMDVVNDTKILAGTISFRGSVSSTSTKQKVPLATLPSLQLFGKSNVRRLKSDCRVCKHRIETERCV
jgi:hypothetical protein